MKKTYIEIRREESSIVGNALDGNANELCIVGIVQEAVALSYNINTFGLLSYLCTSFFFLLIIYLFLFLFFASFFVIIHTEMNRLPQSHFEPSL